MYDSLTSLRIPLSVFSVNPSDRTINAVTPMTLLVAAMAASLTPSTSLTACSMTNRSFHSPPILTIESLLPRNSSCDLERNRTRSLDRKYRLPA